MNQTHAYIQERIQSGKPLSDAEQADITAHLANCPECRAYAAFHRQLAEQLPAIYPQAHHSVQAVREKARSIEGRLTKRRRREQFLQLTFSTTGIAGTIVLLMVVLSLLSGMLAGTPEETAQVPAAVEHQTAESEQTTTADIQPPTAPTSTQLPTSPAVPMKTLPTSEPQPTATKASREERTAVRALAMDGETVYVGSGSRLLAIDIRQPAQPRLLAQSEALPGEVNRVLRIPAQPSSRIAASAGRYLAVFDPSTKGELSLVTQSKLPGPINSLLLEIGPHRIYAGGVLQGDQSRGFITVLDAMQPDVLNLLDTVELDAPVQSLALIGNTLYADLGGGTPGISVLTALDGQLGEPVAVIENIPVSGIAVTQGVLYLAADGEILAYRLDDPYHPEFAWKIDRAGDAPLPENIHGFELRPSRIYAAGTDRSGQPLRMEIPLPKPILTGSVVDTASCITVANGMMLVAGEPGADIALEIYSIIDPRGLTLLGVYSEDLP